MSKSTISTFELFALIPDAETARKYLEARLKPKSEPARKRQSKARKIKREKAK